MTPKWPPRSLRGLVHLFRDIQDIDIYVEDLGDESFYKELLSRALPPKVRLSRVFALGSRTAVLDQASLHKSVGRALFVVDGDLAWVCGKPGPTTPHVLAWSAYCIENLLLDPEAVVRVFQEEAKLTLDEARTTLGFAKWKEEALKFLPLFAAFAMRVEYSAPEASVSNGFGPFMDLEMVSTQKIEERVSQLVAEVAQRVGSNDAEQHLARVRRRIDELEDPLLAVSGKDFLLPHLLMHLKSKTKTGLGKKALRFRLALHCDSSRLREFTNAVLALS